MDNIQTVSGLIISPSRNEVRTTTGAVLTQYQYRPAPSTANMSNAQLDAQLQRDKANNEVSLFNLDTRKFEQFQILSTASVPVLPTTLQPTYELREPWKDPPSTARARTLKDVYSIASNLPIFNFTYQIGIRSTQIYDFLIRNNTTSHVLDFETIAPSFLTLNIPAKFQIDPGEILKFSFALDENDIRQRIFSRTLRYEEVFFLNTKVLDLRGPVYVAIPMTPLTL